MSHFVDRARELFPGRDFIGFYNDDVYIAAPGHSIEMASLVSAWGESFLYPGWKETLSTDAERETRDFGPMFTRAANRAYWKLRNEGRGTPEESALEEEVERGLAVIAAHSLNASANEIARLRLQELDYAGFHYEPPPVYVSEEDMRALQTPGAVVLPLRRFEHDA